MLKSIKSYFRQRENQRLHRKYLNQVRRMIYDNDVSFIGVGITSEEFKKLSKLTNNPKVIAALKTRVMVRTN